MINLLIICTESSEKNKVLHLDKTMIFFDSVLQKTNHPILCVTSLFTCVLLCIGAFLCCPLLDSSHGPSALLSSICFSCLVHEALVCVQIRIWARKKAIEEDQGNYALEKTGPILAFFEDYYGIKYPLNKSGNGRTH